MASSLPSRTLPRLYFASAHLALGLAAALVAWSPRAAAGFFYHSRIVAIVHLVTLGWITNSILGWLYLVGPAMLGIAMPERRRDYVAFLAVAVGIVGMVAHFWIEEFSGMAWSAATATTGMVLVVARVATGLRAAPLPGGVKCHMICATGNLIVAASAGLLLGLDKVHHVLPGFVLSNVFAHAHLAAVGWATMMVVGIGYRLLPIMIHVQAPSGRTVYASAVLIELGVLLLFVALILQSHWSRGGAILIVAGLGCFAAHVVAMVRRRSKTSSGAPAIDFAMLHAAAAGLSLVVACAIGLYLLVAPPSDISLRLAIAYGVFGLVGFLAQIVAPLAAPIRWLQEAIFIAWTFAVPAAAVGFALNAMPLLAAGAWTLLTAIILSAAGHWAVAGPALPDFRRAAGHARRLAKTAR